MGMNKRGRIYLRIWTSAHLDDCSPDVESLERSVVRRSAQEAEVIRGYCLAVRQLPSNQSPRLTLMRNTRAYTILFAG